ncbi:Toll-like receptor 13 [Eufriesea mexicana]|nr:Toll-like receptor 13 [Eufriesea mexicana]
MVKLPRGGDPFMTGWLLTLFLISVSAQLGSECSHSELPKVLEGLKAVSHYLDRPVDELILENNNLPSLPGKVFATLRVLRLMLRNNRLERVSSGWLEGLHDSLLELFVVEPDLRSLPVDSLENLQGLEAVTLQSRVMKKLPKFSGLPKLRYLQINSPALVELAPRNFRDLPSLEQFHVFGSPRLIRLEAGVFRGLTRLELINITDCGIHWVHPRALIDLPELKEISLVGNSIVDAGMIGRACVDLPSLSVIRLDRNRVNRLSEGAFTDLSVLSRLYLSRNYITEVFVGAFQRMPALKILDLNHNLIHRIHPEFFPRRPGNVLEEMWLIHNDLSHVTELRSIMEALPRLKFLDVSHNQIEEIPFGALRGHLTLERLHLDHNRVAFLQRETFTAMPALRELRLKNNSLSNLLETPFWNLPALKGLDLSENYFRHIEPRLLANLPSLRRLDVSGNAVGLIEPDSFLSTPALEYINISGNALSVLHPLTFHHLNNLYELDVGWNRMLEIVPGLPRNIEHLYMPMNRIIILPAVSSQDLDLPVLRSLDLSANGIERIPSGSLADLPNLKKLSLGYNSLRLLENGVFEGLSRLEQLDLKYNRLVTLHGRSFRPLRLLMDLNLRGNRLEVLRPDIFQENIRLQRLDLSRNNLAQIPHATFSNTRDLRELYASHNTLTELPGSLHGLTALQVLDLSFNKLNILSPETLSSLSALLELKLVRNRIRELREGAFNGLPQLTLIDLESNDLRIIERNAIRALPELQAIRLGKNRLQEIASNAFINVPHLLFLNLSHNHLPSLDYVGLESLRSLEVLDLSNNRLSRVLSNSLASMEWLVELKMDNNRICTIQGSPFDEMPRLRVLSLRSNRMASVSETAFKRLRSNIAVLDIDGNPLSCSCGMLWLRGWLQQASSEGPRCADGSLFKEIRLSRQDCQRERQIDPIHPGCEAEMIDTAPYPVSSSIFGATEMVPLLMNLKESSTRNPLHVQESDYFYEYSDYQDNKSNTSNVTFTSTQFATTVASDTVKTTQTTEKIESSTNNTIPVKKITSMPPSPSSSGFTFFGVPLPSLNFNLWGNSRRKFERKNSSGRPGRGRYRTFPPTEPEIHKGGFIPLPRAQGGFVPILDPGLIEREELSTVSINEPDFRWQMTGTKKSSSITNLTKTPDSSTAAGESFQETTETAFTEVYDGKNLKMIKEASKNEDKPQTEMTSRIIWTTPKTALETTKEGLFKETSTEVIKGEKHTYWDSEANEFQETSTSRTATNVQNESIGDPNAVVTEQSTFHSTILENRNNFSSTSQVSRKTEASALSAFLVPGGQVSPLLPNLRPLGRPTITKVPSPRIGLFAESEKQKSVAEAVQRNLENEGEKLFGVDGSSNENAEVFEDNSFNWYFQHYNDTNLEPFVSVAYNGGEKTNMAPWTLLGQLYLILYIFV